MGMIRATKNCWLCDSPSETDECSYCTLGAKSKVGLLAVDWPPKKDELERLYSNMGLSMHAISRLNRRSYSSIHYWMRKYGLVSRDREEASREATRRYPVREFRGGPNEKAYIFGIAKGDLYVREHHKAIGIYTSTSVPSMVDLLVDTFSKYARPWIHSTIYYLRGGKIGGWRVRFCLDHSFAFLLRKYSNALPSWVTTSNQTFLAFLAGFYDAEGHLGIYSSESHRGGPTTELTFTNTDLHLVREIRSRLVAYGFHPRISDEQVKGSSWYILKLGRRNEIRELLVAIPFRHPKKKAVARFMFSIPQRMDARTSSRVIQAYKSMKREMKEEDRQQGLAAVFDAEKGSATVKL
jgi:LAGLIDADG DNA endonuclease family protein